MKPCKSQVPERPVAYSYVRFSSLKQAEGDSLRRQTEAAAAWSERNNARLDTGLTLHDLGKSAYLGKHRENPDRNALAAFLKLVEQGRIPRGSYLVVEALDRLTREDIQPALMLILGLLQAGVRIVQLIPSPQLYTDKSGPHEVMLMVVELMRGHSESKAKSERCGAAWAKKKEEARAGKVMTLNAPRWLKRDVDGHRAILRNGKLVPDPDRVKVVKQVFKLAASGYGLVSIAKKLNKDNIPSFGGRRETWTRSYLAIILKDRRVLGEHQPMKDGKKDGPVIPYYYPAIVSEEEWLAARSGRQERTKKRGRVGKHVNIFAGLLRNALDRGPYHLNSWKVGDRRVLALVNFRATEGLTSCRSFPYDVLEQAALSELRELDPRDFLGGSDDPSNELAAITDEQTKVDEELTALAADMEANGYSATLSARVRLLEDRRGKLAEQIADTKQRSAFPASESWKELKTLAQLLLNSPDPTDVRLRLQSALRRIITEAWMVVVVKGQVRLARLSLYFGGGEHAPFRNYLIVHRPALAPGGKPIRPAQWAVRSIKHPDDQLGFNREDLRNEDGAAWVEGDLKSYPARMIEQLLRDG